MKIPEGTMKPTRTLFMLASEKELRFFENDGVGKGIYQIDDDKIADDLPPGYSDREGLEQAAPGQAVSGFEPPTAIADVTRDAAARDAIRHLEKVWASGRFDRIILTAEPQLLGDLRAHLPEALAGAIYAELPKDLVHVPTDDLAKHFSKTIDL